MVKLRISLSDDEGNEIQKRADSYGLTTSAYIRTLLKDALTKEHQARHSEVLRAIKALIPTLAEAFGKTQSADDELIGRLNKVLLERYAKAMAKGE